MPTNLPPEYFEAEKRYRAAQSTADKIARLEELLSTVPKHKGTDKLRADMRRRLSKLRESAQTKKRVGKRESAFLIDREGAGQVAVIGPTNVGKSALVVALTNAALEVAASPYTTWQPAPGMMPVEDVQIQLIDTPPLNREYIEPALFDLLRRSDLILLVVDLQTDPLQQLEDTISLLRDSHIAPLGPTQSGDEERGVKAIPALVLANKNDDETSDEDVEIFRELVGDDWSVLPVSAATGRNLEGLKRAVFERLGIIRVYSKRPGQDPDLSAPFVLKKGSTVEDLAGKVHKDFLDQLKAARVWGSAAHDGLMVGRDHVLRDGDVVELRI